MECPICYDDSNDSFYLPLPDDKKEAYKDAKLEDVAKDIDETAVKAIEDAENNDFYKTHKISKSENEHISNGILKKRVL